VATSRLPAATSASWLGLLNFMRIFHQGALTRRARNFRFGIEMRVTAVSVPAFGCFFKRSPPAKGLDDRLPATAPFPAAFNLARAAIHQAPRRRSPHGERARDAHLVQYA
jgi:hypothetical protein